MAEIDILWGKSLLKMKFPPENKIISNPHSILGNVFWNTDTLPMLSFFASDGVSSTDGHFIRPKSNSP